MSGTTELESRERRRWSSGEKARLVRRHLQEAVSLADLAEELTGTKIKTRQERYQGQRLEGVVVSAVDNMTTRQTI